MRVCGILNADSWDDADQLPIALPDGVISFLGGSLSGDTSVEPLIDVKIALDGNQICGVLSIDLAEGLIEALRQAIEDAKYVAEIFVAEVKLAENIQ